VNPEPECVGANCPTIIHMGTGSGGLGSAKGGEGVAYVMPDWAGRMIHIILNDDDDDDDDQQYITVVF